MEKERVAAYQAVLEDVGNLSETDYGAESETSAYEYYPPYEQTALRLARSFRAQASRQEGFTPSAATESAFLTIARGIEKCRLTFETWHEARGITPRAEDLMQSLRSPRTINLFLDLAKMSFKVNREYETHLGLRGGGLYGDFGLIYNPDEKCFEFDPEVIEQIKQSASFLSSLGENTTNQNSGCPFVKYIPSTYRKTLEALTPLILEPTPSNTDDKIEL